MPCLHRFANELLPKHPAEFLFIGTFNPQWQTLKGNDPDYFYSRSSNEFWCILPHALNRNCLVDKSRKEKEEFCVKNKVGLSDIIYCIPNVKEEDLESEFLKSGFGDEKFDLKINGKYAFDLTFYTPEITAWIKQNEKTLRGVFLTRKTGSGIRRVWKEWVSIKTYCTTIGIPSIELSSPSTRHGGVRDKIFEWRKEIEEINSKYESQKIGEAP